MNAQKIIATAAFAFAAAALPMSAASASEGKSVSISYADLNLSSEAGVAIFDRRIDRAIEAVCGRLENRPTFDGAVRKCQRETLAAIRPSRDLAVANYSTTRLASTELRIRFAAN